MAALNFYGRISEADQERIIARRKARRRITIIFLSSLVLISIVVAAVFGSMSHNNNDNGKFGNDQTSISSSLKAVCNATLYPDSCFSSLAPLIKSSDFSLDEIYKLSVQVAINELSRTSQTFSQDGGFNKFNISNPFEVKALESCQELLSLALDHLTNSLPLPDKTFLEAFDDVRTWLSAAGTYQQTCIDAFEDNNTLIDSISRILKNSTEYTSNSLAIVTSIEQTVNSFSTVRQRRRLMSSGGMDTKFPYWLKSKGRNLVQSTNNASVVVDIVVAKDGSGMFKTISEALKVVPDKGNRRFVIYVKKGVYLENVIVEKSKFNVMMIGDGMNVTIVSGNLNVVDGTPTFQSATFAVFGKGFIARDMAFINTAGAAKQQAVALISTADFSVFYRCRFDAYQDTLYTHSNRQFYRECDIRGTIDFIFGNAAVVLQNTTILVKQPMSGQKNIVTAQGKSDPNQNTGISIQNCSVRPLGSLIGVETFLGRPWKNYSRTIFMGSYLDNVISPKGWLPWTGTTAPDTIFYAEYQNKGPGSVTNSRVNWRGLKLNINSKLANLFTVTKFLSGNQWLPPTSVPFIAGL